MTLVDRSRRVPAVRASVPRPTQRSPAPLVLVGEHDIATVDAVAAMFAVAIADHAVDVVVDLSGVTFLGAATVAVIVRARRLLEARGRSLTLQSPSRVAGRVLDLCDVA